MADLYRTIVVDPPWPYTQGWPTRKENGTELPCPICERTILRSDLYGDGCPYCETWVECGCDYELVEDGSVQRIRWFHDPECPRG